MNDVIEVKIPGKTVGYLLEKSQEKMETDVAIPDPSSPEFISGVNLLCALQATKMKWNGGNLIGQANDISIAFCQLIVAQIQPPNACVFRCSTDRRVRGGFMGVIGRLGSILTIPNCPTEEKLMVGRSLKKIANEVAGCENFYVRP